MKPTATVPALVAAILLLACRGGQEPADTFSTAGAAQGDTAADGFLGGTDGASADAGTVVADSANDVAAGDAADGLNDADVDGGQESDAAMDSDGLVGSDTAELGDLPGELDAAAGEVSAQADTDTGPNTDTAGDAAKAWTVVGGCAVPQPVPLSAECVNAACGADEICVANGTCVPAGAMDLPGPTTLAVPESIAAREDGVWAVSYRTIVAPQVLGSPEFVVRVAAFGGIGPDSVTVLEVPTLPGTSTQWSAVQPRADGGWIVVGARRYTATGKLEYWSWPIGAGGQGLASAPYLVSQSPMTTDGKVYGSWSSGPLAALRDGNFLAAWDGSLGGPTSDPLSVRLRYLDAAGVPIGKELKMGPVTMPSGLFGPALAALDEGAALMVYASNAKKGTATTVQGMVLGVLAESPGVPFGVSPGLMALESLPTVSTWLDSSALIAWKAGQTAAKTGPVHVKLQAWSTKVPTAIGNVHELDFDSEGSSPATPALATLDSDRAVAVWANMASSLNSIYFVRYYKEDDVVDCTKTDVAGPLVAKETPSRGYPLVVSLGGGSFVVVWLADIPVVPGVPNPHPRLRYFAH